MKNIPGSKIMSLIIHWDLTDLEYGSVLQCYILAEVA